MGRTSGTLLITIVLTAALLGVIVATPEAGQNDVFDFEPVNLAAESVPDDLPRVRSYTHLKKLIAESSGNVMQADGMFRRSPRGRWPVQTRGARLRLDSFAAESTPARAVPQMMLKRADADPSFSRTNVQVRDVDEADIVKTDGRYIYQVSREELIVTRAEPGRPLKKITHLDFTKDEFIPKELFIADNRLVVVGDEYGSLEATRAPYFDHIPENSTVAHVYEAIDGRLKHIKGVQIEGSYLSSRRVDSRLVLMTNKPILAGIVEPYPHSEEDMAEADIADPAETQFKESSLPPGSRDSASDRVLIRPDFKDIRYFPDFAQANYLTVSFIELDANTPVQSTTLLGGGEQVYASAANLYIAQTIFKEPDEATTATAPLEEPGAEIMPASSPETSLFRFSLTADKPVLQGRGSVPGTLLNQFSMDEHERYFRVATTVQDGSTNNVYVLNEDLEITGRLEGLAPGERIYSARFMGDRAYMVTFKQVDPLFVIDLSRPDDPNVLGELKIPGYSDYLHPLDDNHIIGFGKDTEDQGDFALMKGVKVAVFDVSDVKHPREKWKTVIGDRGTDSAVLRDHRALLHSPERDLLAFPVSVTERGSPINQREGRTGPGGVMFDRFNYTAFQGVYVYRIEPDMTLTERGRISHFEDGVEPWPRMKEFVKRALYIDDTLFTVSDRMIKANRLDDLSEVDSLIVTDPL